jgi:bifunctional DNA-binding transcriptional regulator/antitoxin component of YhaV-PrlF toxin-antitoxin module
MPKLQMIKRSNGSLVFSVNIPLETIEELGWKKGDEISAEIKKVRDSNIIVLEKQEGEKDGSSV